MPCKKKYSDFIKINNLRFHGQIDGMIFFDLVSGPLKVQNCAYKWRTGSIMFPRCYNMKRFVTVKGSFISDLRQLILPELAKLQGVREIPEEYRFPKKERK